MFSQAPNEWTIAGITKHIKEGSQTLTHQGVWEPARPYGLYSMMYRIKLAWKVFTGEADALLWPDQRTDAY